MTRAVNRLTGRQVATLKRPADNADGAGSSNGGGFATSTTISGLAGAAALAGAGYRVHTAAGRGGKNIMARAA